MQDNEQEIENAILALSDNLAKQVTTQPTKSKKKRERLRLKQLQKKVNELEANNADAHGEVAVVKQKPFPFLELPPGKLPRLFNI